MAPPQDWHRDERSTDWRLELFVLAIFVLGFALFFGMEPRVFDEGDVSWHIAAGQWMIAHRAIPYVDLFSYTAFGKPWVTHEWLAEVIMAFVFNSVGFRGIALLVAAALALTFLILGLRLKRWMRPVELCAALMVIALALYPFVIARPMVLAWPILALWLELILRARAQGRLPSWVLIPLTTIWVNFHASFAIGLALLAMFGLEALIESHERRRTFIQWLLFGGACGLAALINPHGLAGVLFPLGVFSSSTVNLIAEFHPTDFSRWPTFELVLLLFLATGFARGAKLAPVRLLVVLVMLHLALMHVRHQALFVIVAGLVALPAMTRAWIAAEPSGPGLLHVLRTRRGVTVAAIGAICAGALGVAIRLAFPVGPLDGEANPTAAFSHISPALRRERVLNDYNFGGPLILRGVPVFIDGRTDVYGDAFFLRYLDIVNLAKPEAFAAAQAEWRFCWTILGTQRVELIAFLDRSREWRRFYSDKNAIIHVRTPCVPSAR